jgi:hypothetical protein
MPINSVPPSNQPVVEPGRSLSRAPLLRPGHPLHGLRAAPRSSRPGATPYAACITASSFPFGSVK